MSAYPEIVEQLLAVRILRALRSFYKYRELEEIFDLVAPIIWRYISGKVLPSKDRAREILDKVIELKLAEKIVEKALKVGKRGYPDLSRIIYDADVLSILAYEAYRVFESMRPTTILTVAVDGIPLSVFTAEMFGARLVIAKKEREAWVDDYYEEQILQRDPPLITSIYVPRNSIKYNDIVLIVDDLMRTGKTVKASINIVRKAGARLAGVFTMVAIGNEWRQTLSNENVKLHIVYTLP